MGALTIKSYYYESRPWELSKICVPNLLTAYPNYVLLYFKNESLLKILPWNRNEFISNELRFSLDFFSSIFDLNKTKPLTKDFLNIFVLYIVMLQYIPNLYTFRFKIIINLKGYIFNLYSHFFVIHNYLNNKFFNLKLKNYKLLQSSNLKFLNFSHFGFLKNFNDCLNDYFLRICIDQNHIIKFTDFYYYLYNNGLLLSSNNMSEDEDNGIIDKHPMNVYDKFFILNFLIKNYDNFNIRFFYKLILKKISKKLIMDFSVLGVTLTDMLSKYFPYHISYQNINTSSYDLSCSFSSFNYINSIGFIMLEDFKNLKFNKKKKE